MRILVTGTKGNLACRISGVLETAHKDVEVMQISVRGDNWESDVECGDFDAIIHCAGLIGNAATTEEEYYRTNVELTERVYRFANEKKIPHFVHLSSMAVYDSTNWGFGANGIITGLTTPCASSKYGKSKLMSENVLLNANKKEDSIVLSIVRAPSIVGKGMEKYFLTYEHIVKLPFVINTFREAKRSFVYVDTLIEFMYYIIKNKMGGVFFPQNLPLLSVSEICEEMNLVRGANKPVVNIPKCIIPKKIAKKFFSQICYSPDLSESINKEVGRISSREVIRICEKEMY